MHHSGALSVLIHCNLEIYLYDCPVGLALVITQDLTQKMNHFGAFLWGPSDYIGKNFSKSQFVTQKNFSLTQSIHQKSPTTTTTYCIYCIPITASPSGGRAGGESSADIQITQKMHQNRAFSMSIPCTHETYL